MEPGCGKVELADVFAAYLYSYHCKECDKDAELLVRLAETPACPVCASQELERLMSRTPPQGKSAGIAKAGRTQAARAGHLSNFSRSERRG